MNVIGENGINQIRSTKHPASGGQNETPKFYSSSDNTALKYKNLYDSQTGQLKLREIKNHLLCERKIELEELKDIIEKFDKIICSFTFKLRY